MIQNSKYGLFITLEGVEGCGKTTQTELLFNYLKDKRISVIKTREPGGTKLGEEIRNLLLNPENKNIDYLCELLLYNSARAQLIKEVIKPALEEKSIVICDRFFDASFAYQGFGRNIPLEIIHTLDKIVLKNILPDLTILLDIDPEEGIRRINKEDKGDRLEQEDISFHRKVREGYLSLARSFPKRIKTIPGNQSIKEIHHEVCIKVESLISRNRKRIKII